MTHSSSLSESETPFDSFVSQFLHSRTNQRLSRRSQEIYQRDTATLVEHFVACGLEQFSEVTGGHIDALTRQIIDADEGEQARAARTLSVGRLLFSHAVGRLLVEEGANPMLAVRPIRVDIEELYPEHSPDVLAAIGRVPNDTPENIRDRSLLRAMYMSGIWMGGVVALNCFHPTQPPLCTVFPEGVVRYRSKGGLVEHTMLDRVTMEWIDQWLTARHRLSTDSHEEAIWVTRQGGRILRATVAARIRKHAKLTEFNPITDHLEPVTLMP